MIDIILADDDEDDAAGPDGEEEAEVRKVEGKTEVARCTSPPLLNNEISADVVFSAG